MPLQIEVDGVDGSHWDIDGPKAGLQGVTLRPKIRGFFDMPVKTLWTPGRDSSRYEGSRSKRRDPVCTVDVFAEDGRPETWMEIDSNWRMAHDYDDEARYSFTPLDEAGNQIGDKRSLGVRLLQEPESYGDKDPMLTADAPVGMFLACEHPEWIAPTVTATWVLPSGTSGTGYLPAWNPTDLDLYFQWVVTSPVTGTVWTLPDRSFKADADANRTVKTPALQAGEHLTIDTYGGEEPFVSTNKLPTWQRAEGRGFLYKMPKHTGTEANPIMLPVSVTGGVAGQSAVLLRCPRKYSRPIGVKR